MSKAFFINATGTEVGKSFILQKLCEEYKKNNQSFTAIKPLISGFSMEDEESDSAKILRILGKELNKKNLDEISPWRFRAPLSPNIAAAMENIAVDFLDVVNFCENKILEARKNNQNILIEGAGGVMTPINDHKNFCDLMSILNIPVIFVMGDYLGCISHALTSLKALESYKIEVEKIILNCRSNDVNNAQNILKTMKNFTNIKIEELIG